MRLIVKTIASTLLSLAVRDIYLRATENKRLSEKS